MKNRINLLSKQEKYLKLARLFESLRIGIMVLGLAIFTLDIIFFGFLIRQKRQLDLLSTEKKKILDFLLANKEAEAKFVYFRNKENQISALLKNDVQFYPYYNVLNTSLSSASPSGRLESLIIDKNKEVEFSVGFNDIASLTSFFKFAESESFLSNFAKLNLNGFNIGKQGGKSYQLGFKGKFNNLKQ